MAPELHQVAGNPAMPGFTAPKLLWVRRHEPEHFQRTATVLLPGLSALPDDREESLRYVGRRRDAVAGRGEARLVRRLLDKCGLSRSQMPTLVEGCEVSATP